MKNKNIVIFLSAFMILLMLNFFVIAAEEQTKNDVVTQNIKPLINEQTKETTYAFTSKDSALKIGNNDYWNIQPQTNETQAYIKTDANLKIIGADFKVNENGATYIFGNNEFYAPPNSHIVFQNGKITIDAPEGSSFKEIPRVIEKQDSALSFNTFEITGNNIKLPSGNILNSGTIYTDVFDKNALLIKQNSVIDNIKVYPYASSSDMRLFLDGVSHPDVEDSYISLDGKDKMLYFNYNNQKQNPYVLEFLKDNPFVKIEENDRFAIKTVFLSKLDLSITNPDSKIPSINIDKISTAGEEKKDTAYPFMVNGNKILSKANQGVYISSSKNAPNFAAIQSCDACDNPTPFTLTSKDPALDLKGSTFLMDNLGDYFLSREKSVIERESSLNYQYGENSKADADSLNKAFKDIKFKGIEKLSSYKISDVKEELSQLPDDMLKDLKSLSIVKPGTTIKNVVGADYIVQGGGATGLGNIAIVDEAIYAIPHEVAHEHTLKFVTQQTTDAITQILPDIISQIDKKQGVSLTQEDFAIDIHAGGLFPYAKVITLKPEKEKELGENGKVINNDLYLLGNPMAPRFGEGVLKAMQNAFTPSIEKEWYAIQPEKDFQSEKETLAKISKGEDYGSQIWSDGTSAPRNGFLTPYGASAFTEDISETVRTAINEPETFKDLINPKSSNYDLKYRQKLDFLYKYKYITPERYKQILSSAGIE